MTSTLESPTHLYGADGVYTVTLEACNSMSQCDTYSDAVEVLPLPVAGFTYVVNELSVDFTNTSTGADTYWWDFGDTYTSTLEHPSHTYAAAGTYTVTLWASGDCGSDVFSDTVTTMAPSYGVDVVASDATLEDYVGNVVTYTLTVWNDGSVEDSFTVGIGSHVFTTTASAPTVGPLAAAASDTLEVYVDIPMGATDGMTDAVDVTLTSVGDTNESATETLTTTALWFRHYLPLVFKDY
jgi:PKD repeat protein